MLSLKDSLIDEDVIQLDQQANDWETSIRVATAPLVKSQAITTEYPDAIIAATKELGPYYILTDFMAMPHATPKDYVKRDAFSFTTFPEGVIFPGNKIVKVMVVLAATSSEVHVSIAIPQIIAVFEQKDIIKTILAAKSKADILEIIENADYSQYVEQKG